MIPTLYEPFRHWSDGGSVYILSDLHFDDEDCKFMSPDWITPEEQLSVINGIVMKNDTFSTYNRMQWAGEEYLLEEVIDEAANRLKKPGKEIIKLAPVKVMRQNYEWLYAMTPEEVIEILKENN